jgi:uncharacterized RmlC-like cupin family protein
LFGDRRPRRSEATGRQATTSSAPITVRPISPSFRTRCAPGFRTGVHHHTADSLALITAGRALFRWGRDLQEEVELGPGDWLYVGAGEIHEELTPDDARAEMVVILNRGGGESVFK